MMKARARAITASTSGQRFAKPAGKAMVAGRRAQRQSRLVCDASAIDRSYAEALVECAYESDVLEEVQANMQQMQEYLGKNEDVLDFLKAPVVDAAAKIEIIQKIAGEGEFHKYTTNFLCVLVEKKRIDMIKEVIKSFEEYYGEKTDTQTATLLYAMPVDSEDQFAIAKWVQEATGATNVKIKAQFDPKILGGCVVKYGEGQSDIMDMSVRGTWNQVINAVGNVNILGDGSLPDLVALKKGELKFGTSTKEDTSDLFDEADLDTEDEKCKAAMAKLTAEFAEKKKAALAEKEAEDAAKLPKLMSEMSEAELEAIGV